MASVRREDDPIFDAYRRNDSYGRVGRAPQPMLENIRLTVMAVTIVPMKALGALLTLVSYWACCHLSRLLPHRWQGPVACNLGRLHCRICLLWLGFFRLRYMSVQVDPKDPNGKPAPGDAGTVKTSGYVCNHAGWADILIAMSLFFPSFVARVSTKDIPFVGIISRMMGCLYVDRAAANGSQGVSALVKQRMQAVAEGKDPTLRPMLLFPEGTTTNNRHLLCFRTGAFLAGTPLQPIMIVYDRDDPISLSWESIPIQRHMFLVLANPFHSATVYEFPVYVPSPAEKADPKLYACNMREHMLKYGPHGFAPSNATFADKQEYLALLNVAQDVPYKKQQQDGSTVGTSVAAPPAAAAGSNGSAVLPASCKAAADGLQPALAKKAV